MSRIDGTHDVPRPEGSGDDEHKPLETPSLSQETSLPGGRDLPLDRLPARTKRKDGNAGALPVTGSSALAKPRSGSAIQALEVSLMARVRQQDPSVQIVYPGHTRSVDVAQGDEMQLFTVYVCDSLAMAIISRYPCGRCSCTLSHHDQSNVNLQTKELEAEMPHHHPDHPDVVREILIVAPGVTVWREDGTREFQAKQDKAFDALRDWLAERLPGTQSKVLPYMPWATSLQSIFFILDIPAQADQPIHYKGVVDGKCAL